MISDEASLESVIQSTIKLAVSWGLQFSPCRHVWILMFEQDLLDCWANLWQSDLIRLEFLGSMQHAKSLWGGSLFGCWKLLKFCWSPKNGFYLHCQEHKNTESLLAPNEFLLNTLDIYLTTSNVVHRWHIFDTFKEPWCGWIGWRFLHLYNRLAIIWVDLARLSADSWTCFPSHKVLACSINKWLHLDTLECDNLLSLCHDEIVKDTFICWSSLWHSCEGPVHNYVKGSETKRFEGWFCIWHALKGGCEWAFWLKFLKY